MMRNRNSQVLLEYKLVKTTWKSSLAVSDKIEDCYAFLRECIREQRYVKKGKFILALLVVERSWR